jgi:hypothetical protein
MVVRLLGAGTGNEYGPAGGCVMSAADFSADGGKSKPGFFSKMRAGKNAPSGATAANASAPVQTDVLKPDAARKRERFIPITRFALMDRLTLPSAWKPGEAQDVRRFFRYLDYWRQQQYNVKLLELDQVYETFSPDSDLLMTRQFSDDERRNLKHRVVTGVEDFLQRANYEKIDPADVDLILTKDSHYGLDLMVDMKAFEDILIYYRGASNKKHERRRFKMFGRKQEFDVPVFQRLFILFKLKPFDARVEEHMRDEKLSREQAEKLVRKHRANLPPSINEKNIYLKLFKNIPRTDIEMVFPNTQVRFRTFDKLKLGVSTGSGLGMGAVGAAGKVALLATNPLAAAGAVAGLGGIAFRQATSFMTQKQKYMVVMAQNLYFHTMADNRGVILKIASRGAEEDIKEEMLLYTVLAKEKASRADLPAIDQAIEQYLTRTFGIKVDFDLEDALERLLRDGIVKESADGKLTTLGPKDAAEHIDAKWDLFLDELPDPISAESYEFNAAAPPPKA